MTMTNAVERMYKEYGVEKEEYRTPGRDWDDEGLASWYVEYDYPTFTAEKQIELLRR